MTLLDDIDPDDILAAYEAADTETKAELLGLLEHLDAWRESQVQLFPRQRLAEELSAEAGELLYGGAAGGGKTHWLIEHAIAQAEAHPGNRVLILRRVWPSVSRTIEPRMKIRLHGKATYNSLRHDFTFDNGSVIELGACQYGDDVLKYQGAEYGCILFEELTEFLESQFEYLLGRLRAPVDGVRAHVIGTTNPGGVGHAWVKRRYISELNGDGTRVRRPIEEVWKPDPTEREPDPPTRAFVPAVLDDNPALIERDPTYRQRLRAISHAGRRRALELGDWDAIDQAEGALWSLSDLDEHRWRDVDRGSLVGCVVAVDPSVGGSDETGIIVVGSVRDTHGKLSGVVLEDCSMPNPTPKQWALAAIDAYHRWQADRIVGERNNGGDLVERNIHVEDATVPVKAVWASRGKRIRAEPVSSLAKPDVDGDVRWHMVGNHPILEDQLTSWDPDGGGESPDRLDAMVWGGTELLVEGGATTGSSNAGFFDDDTEDIWIGSSV